MGKSQFAFKKEWKDAIFWLSDSMRLQFYEAVIEYGLTGKLPTLSPLLMRAFNLAKEDIDNSNEQEETEIEEIQEDVTENIDESDSHNEPEENHTTAKKKDLQKREQAFYKTLVPFINDYGKETIDDFFRYWSEPNKSRTKMRYELERTWDVGRRLSTWDRNNKKQNINSYGKTAQYHSSAEQRTADTANLLTDLLLK